MTNYAVTLTKRDGHKKGERLKIRPELYTLYEGSEANNNWHCLLYINKDETQAANNDTVTITLG
jgi:hypothetical protein